MNRWLSVRFNLLSSGLVGVTGLACLITPNITASMAGFALAFASTITSDLLFMVRRFVGLEQSMVCNFRSRIHSNISHDFTKVALERVKEYTDLQREPPEFIEPRPEPSWPTHGVIKCENLDIRYAVSCMPDSLCFLSLMHTT